MLHKQIEYDLKNGLIIIFHILDSFRAPAGTWLKRHRLNQSPARIQRQQINTLTPWHHLSLGRLTAIWAHVRPSWPRNSRAWSSKTACLEVQTWATTRVWPSTPHACWRLPTPPRILTKPSWKPAFWRGRHTSRGKVTSTNLNLHEKIFSSSTTWLLFVSELYSVEKISQMFTPSRVPWFQRLGVLSLEVLVLMWSWVCVL